MRENLLTETDRLVIYHRVASRLVNENMLQSFVGSALSALGPNADKIIPDSIATGFKKKIIKSVFERLNIDKGGGLSDFIENIIANVSIEDLGKMLNKSITCEEVSAILVSATTMSIANQGLKKALVPVVHYFSQYEIREGFDIQKKKSGKDFKAVSEKHVEQMLDTLIGVLGEALLAKLVDALIKDVLVTFISTHICTKLGFKSAPVSNTKTNPNQNNPNQANPSPTSTPQTPAPAPQSQPLTVLPPAPQIGQKQQLALPGPVNESNEEMKKLLKNSYRKNFTINEFKRVKIAMEII